MRTLSTTFLLALLSLIINPTTLAEDRELDWYVLGSGSIVLARDYAVDTALGVGAGVQINQRLGIELCWDASGVEPRDLIQKANLPKTIAPLQIDVQSHNYHFLSALAVRTFPFRGPFSLLGKAGLARHWKSMEFDVWTSGTVFMERFEVEESETLPVAALGIELASNRFETLSFEFLLTNFFEKRNNTILFSAAVKIKF
ncbi:MAG: porin family protein [Gammaproteobacteria bacterium]|nr:porin family protein [Gammaproteobacteria bacterium]